MRPTKTCPLAALAVLVGATAPAALAQTITQIIDSSGDGTHPFSSPRGMAVDAAGNVFLSGGSSDNVFRVAPDGTITQILDATA